MKYYSLLAAWALGLSLVSAPILAQESKIGFINYQRITTESAPAKQAQAKMELDFSKRQKELSEQQALLRTLQEKYERDAPTLSESQRLAKQKEFAETGAVAAMKSCNSCWIKLPRRSSRWQKQKNTMW